MGSKDSSVIYFVRHGECMGNITRRNLSPDEAILTENGKLQAKLLGEHLKDVKFTLAYTSDYARTLETTEIILSESKVSSNLELNRDVKLRERYMGKFENGAEIKDFLADFVASGKDFMDYVPEGGETKSAVEGRIEEFLQEIFSKIDTTPNPQTILTVTHGATLLHLWRYLTEATSKYALKNWKPEYYKVTRNTGYYILEVKRLEEGSATPRELNMVAALCSGHLESVDRDTLETFTREVKVANAFEGCIQQ